MKVFILILLAAVLLVILVPVIRLGVAALGTPADRAAVNQSLRSAAGLLGGQFRDRLEYPWYRRRVTA
jgi:ABC-type transport system involved in cytochrome bd biosynthesis fused ATPase/permease subunit